jgi:hypothetical protein
MMGIQGMKVTFDCFLGFLRTNEPNLCKLPQYGALDWLISCHKCCAATGITHPVASNRHFLEKWGV